MWTWSPRDPTGIVAMGNPPSGAAGGYGWFDLVAVMVAPALLVVLADLRVRLRGWTRPTPEPVMSLDD